MTRHSDTLTTVLAPAASCAHGVDHDREVPCRACEPIATYQFGASGNDAAARHATALQGRAVLNEDDGLWTVYGDPQREARRVLDATSDKALLRQYRRSTYAVAALRDTERQANRENKTALASITAERRADAEAARDLIEAEVLRRMGGE